MAFESGGRADKLGNRHERWWVVKQLLRLLRGEITSVTIEAVGDDEKGVDVWIEKKDGTRQAQQCKARNGDKEGWSVNDLKNKGIIRNLQYQLDRKQNHEFAFVSAVPCTLLGDICESARNSSGDAETFYLNQIQQRGVGTKRAFSDFCNALSIDDSTIEGHQEAYNYLKRTKIIVFSDDESTRNDLRVEVGYLLTGESELIITSLISYAENNNKLGSPIRVSDLYAYFRENNIIPRDLAQNPQVVLEIEKLQREFEQSIQPFLIKGELIPRKEVKQCIQALEENGLVIITGDSGVGKSGILYDVTCKLREQGVPYIPVRVDRRIPKNTARQYGIDIGLPDSPVHCLKAIGGEQSSVLIIDQLDAIRWTSKHNSNALDVCKEMINQVMAFRRDGKDIRVILSCRSFDLSYDVELKKWLEASSKNGRETWSKIEIGLLPDEFMQNLLGEAYSSANKKKKLLLARPQNLFMWFELIDEENRSTFKSSIDLMRVFWNKKLQAIEKEGIKIIDVTAILDTLLDYIEKKGGISVSSRVLLRCSREAFTSMKSNGIIREQGNTVIFSHQSYLDFLIADKIVESIDNGESILCWIGNKEKQTLFRREQLKEALIIMCEDNSYDFTKIVKEVLFSNDVRFHLKHLVLEVIGNIEDFNFNMVVLLQELLDNNEWKSHVLDTVFLGNAKATSLLIETKRIHNWLNSANEEQVNTALNLISRVKDTLSEEIVNIFTPYIYSEEQWKRKILAVIGWNIETDSEEIFKLRLKLADKKVYSQYVNWKLVGTKFPLRAIQYIESILKSYELGEELNTRNNASRVGKWYKGDLDALIDVSQNNAIKTWDILMPQLYRLINVNNEKDFELERIYESEGYTALTKGVTKLLIAAGQQMAAKFPNDFINRILKFKNEPSKVIQQIIGESFSCLNVDYADVGVQWLMEDPSRLILGQRFGDPNFQLAGSLIKTLSPYCSQKVFYKLEQFLLHYHEPNEHYLAKVSLEERRKGNYWNYWGKAQYLLLTQLCKDRIGVEASDLIKVLRRRYNGHSSEYFMKKSGSKAGFIGSKLDRNLFKLSDNAWLKIVKNKKVQEDYKGMWTEANDGLLLETSIRHFSRNLETVAKEDPERFGELVLKFPKGVSPQYISAILRAFRLKEYESERVSNEEWKPASPKVIIAVLNKYLTKENREIVMEFCGLLRAREDIDWPMELIEQLIDIASSHPDPEPETMHLYNSNWDKKMEILSSKELFENSINCVRGVAVEAITCLLWRNPTLFEKVRNIIDSLTNDAHPSVRINLIGMLLPVLNINKEKAVEWFARTVKQDLRIACSQYGISFINHTIKPFSDIVGNIVLDMMNSKNNEVAKLGGEMVGAYYIFYGFFAEECIKCCNGSIAQKKAIVKVATSNINEEKYSEKCIELLNPFLENYESEVAEEMAGLFRHELDDLKTHMWIVKKYIHSPYLEDNDLLIHQLDNYEGKLIGLNEIILSFCGEICDHHSSKTRDIGSRFMYLTSELSKLLLRLYEESIEIGQRDILNACLDMWDRFFEKKIGSVRELTKIVEEI